MSHKAHEVYLLKKRNKSYKNNILPVYIARQL